MWIDGPIRSTKQFNQLLSMIQRELILARKQTLDAAVEGRDLFDWPAMNRPARVSCGQGARGEFNLN
jgi:hypothetical protein